MPASGSITITPSITFTADTSVTHAELNLAARPQARLNDGEVGPDQLDLAEVKAALGEAAASSNYFLNPNFASVNWQRGTSAVSCPVATYTYRADDWWCNPAGAAVTYERVQAGPNNLSLHSALLTGATSVTTVDFGQDIPAHLSTVLCDEVAVSVWVYNATGASLTPTLRIDSANVLDVFTAVTNRTSTASSTAGTVAAWTKHTWLVDLSTVPDCANGLRVYLRFPSGSLNSAAKSVRVAQAKIELGTSATAFIVPVEAAQSSETVDETTPTAGVAEFLRNPDFRADRWGSTSAITLTNATYVYGPEGWWANAAGSGNTARLQRDTTVPNDLSLHSAKITGGAGTNEVNFGQDFPSQIGAAMRRSMAFAIEFYNGTGNAVTPVLRLDTYDAVDVPTAVTNRLVQSLGSCPDAQWTRLTHVFDGAALTNLLRGGRIYIQIPSASLDTTGEVVRFAQASLAPGLSALDYAPPGPQPPPATLTGAALGLRASWASNSTVTIAATEIILRDSAGETLRVAPLSATINLATASAVNGTDGFTEAADTWYYLWAISDGTTSGGLISASATSPTLPAGYRFRALIGVCRNDGSSNLINFRQLGDTVSTATVKPADCTAFTIPITPTEFDCSDAIPPIARMVMGNIGMDNSSTNMRVYLSPLSGTLGRCLLSGISEATFWPGASLAANGYKTSAQFVLPLVSQSIWMESSDAALGYNLEVTGYILDR